MSERTPPSPFNTWGEMRRRAWNMSVADPDTPPPAKKKTPREPSVYFFKRGNSIKIGFSTNWRKRLKQLRTGGAEPLVPLLVLAGPPSSEKLFHLRFSSDRITPRQEWFRPSDDLVQFIAANATDCLMKSDGEGAGK